MKVNLFFQDVCYFQLIFYSMLEDNELTLKAYKFLMNILGFKGLREFTGIYFLHGDRVLK